uniref:hypothetical protein n=1 Tax=Castellaniella defragrans TaxID=75697 RepID=UPI003342314E
MLRILGQISISGTKASIDRCASIARIPRGTIMRTGLARKVPPADSWCYSSPWYRFNFHTMDQEIRSFVMAHAQLGKALAGHDAGITYALFTLCPVEQTFEETFSGLLSRETLQALSCLGVGLEIAPAVLMPDVPCWVEYDKPM